MLLGLQYRSGDNVIDFLSGLSPYWGCSPETINIVSQIRNKERAYFLLIISAMLHLNSCPTCRTCVGMVMV